MVWPNSVGLMGLDLGKLTQTIISPVKPQLAGQIKLDLLGWDWVNVQKTIINSIPAGRRNKVGLMGFGQIELDLWFLARKSLHKP